MKTCSESVHGHAFNLTIDFGKLTRLRPLGLAGLAYLSASQGALGAYWALLTLTSIDLGSSIVKAALARPKEKRAPSVGEP